MRIGGLASGMDTDQIVKQMMEAENIRVDRVKAEKQILEWKKESLNSLNKDLANFVLDSKKDLGYNSSGKPGNLDWIKSAISSDESIGTGKAGKGAFEGKHTVNVTQLAKGVSGVSGGDGLTEEEKKWKVAEGEAFDFMINNKKVSLVEGDTIESVARKINGAGAGVQASYDEKLGRFFISTDKEGINAEIEFKGFEVVNGKDASPEEIQANADKTAANAEKIGIFLGVINVEIKEASTDVGTILGSNKGLTGTKGEAIYNGIKTDIDSNQFTFNGVNFDAKAEGVFTVTVGNDTDQIVDKVKEFIDNYNMIIEKAGMLVKEKSDRNFKPLTDAEREAMSDKEVELWEQKAKAGLLARDMDIEKMLSNLRSDLYKDLEGASGMFKNITEIGITTQEYKAGSAGGLLQIDEDALRDAISRDSDGVMEVLFKDGGSKKPTDGEAEGGTKSLAGTTDKGLFSRIFDNITNGMKDIIDKSGPGEDSALFRKVKSTIMTDFVTKGGKYSGKGSISDLDDDMSKFTKRIDELKIALFRKENMYYARFAAMEKALQRANSQGDWLMGQM